MLPLFLTILACNPSPADAIQAYRDALAAIEHDASDTAAICGPLEDPQLKADCLIAGAESVASTNASTAATLCERISPTINEGISRDECLFQVAERSKDPTRCVSAGRFADPCRMHLWGSHVPALQGETWEEKERSAHSQLGQYGLKETDSRPWIALYRWLLSQEHPLTRRDCATSVREASCMKAGESLLQDRLNRAVGLKQLPCTPDAPLPSRLQVTEDKELSNMITQRQETECQ
jgi:hypothetical protein